MERVEPGGLPPVGFALRSRTAILDSCRRLLFLREKLIKIGAKVVSLGRYIAFQMADS